MSPLRVRLKRAPDGSAVLTAIRADGSSTLQRQLGPRGQFFPTHDLTHYAVETVLGYREGFFGLIAEGWEISDFAPPFPRGSIPSKAREVEIVVSLIDTGRPDAAGWTAGEFREQGELYVASRRATGKDPGDMAAVSDEDLDRIYALRGELLERWAATKAGETLDLVFGGPARS
ncbi:MAG: hypothetical protein ACR2MW_08405 [Chthoniobacterales bacterium]